MNLELKKDFSINVVELSLQDMIELHKDLIKNGDLDVFQIEFSENVIKESKSLLKQIKKERKNVS